MFRSATFKLTLWYMGLVMALSIIFSFALYKVASGELAVGLDHQSQRISSQFPVFQNDPILRPNVDLDDSDHQLIVRFVLFNIVVLVSAGFASYWLAIRTLKPIEDAHEQQKRFTADVSHELRTPLTALKMESEVALMNKHVTADELRETLHSNLEEASKLEALINNLLRLTRLEAEELRQNFISQDTNDLISKAIKGVEIAADLQHITINYKPTNLTVVGDENSIVQLLIILLDNAIKYSSRGSIVNVNCKRSGNNITISIVDHGKGIEKDALEHVFDRFYRADDSRTKNAVQGYGLGLSIAKMISDVHDGTITLSSRLGNGTKAIVTLPTDYPTKNHHP